MAANHFPPVMLTTARATLDDFLKSQTPEHPLPDHLRIIVERERDTIRDTIKSLNNIERLAPATPGPVLSVLLDEPTETVADTDLPERVRAVISTNRLSPRLHTTLLMSLAVLLIVGAGAIYTVHAVNPLMLFPLIGLAYLAFSMGRPDKTPRYQRLSFDDALSLARYRRERLTLRAANPPRRLRTPANQLAQPQLSTSTPSHPRRAQRIAEVHAAVTELDQEWLDYQLDLRAWFLTKPQLRNTSDPVMIAYRNAYATLRDKADQLTDTATEDQIYDAQQAARTALKTWGAANAHALALGVSHLSPSEEAALSRLHGLVSQLNDRATPKAMWPQLIDAITRSMAKLTTVPFALADIAKQPVIAAESRLRELTS